MTRRERKALWEMAYKEFLRRAGSAKFLYETHRDRQTAAHYTGEYRRQMGVFWRAPAERAGLRTRGADGESRQTTWISNPRKGIQVLTPLAERVRLQSYRCGLLRLAQWDKPNGRGKRSVAVPSVYDRLIAAVLLEILEPLVDPGLSPFQHGYRATHLDGRVVELPGFPGVPRGSTKIVAYRLRRAVNGGHLFLSEWDIINAFPSVDRAILRQMLIEDGCPAKFARLILRCLGTQAIDPRRNGELVEVTGIPLGSPIGPLMFNFYVARVHHTARPGSVITSYADNFFVASRSKDGRSETVRDMEAILDTLNLKAKEKQRLSLGAGDRPHEFQVLRDWEIRWAGDRAELRERRRSRSPRGKDSPWGSGFPLHGDLGSGRPGEPEERHLL